MDESERWCTLVLEVDALAQATVGGHSEYLDANERVYYVVSLLLPRHLRQLVRAQHLHHTTHSYSHEHELLLTFLRMYGNI